VTAIWSSIAEQYLDRHWVQFWPRQFMDSATEREVLAVLKSLVAAGKLRDLILLYCPDGHRAWSGPAADAPSVIGSACSQCELTVDGDSVDLSFVIMPTTQAELDATRAFVEKKSPPPM
jgi:hypothetical protein